MKMMELKSLIEKNKDAFEAYYHLLVKWNKAYNITTITKHDDVFERHFLDSLAALPFIPKESTVLDIGSGGGFPGIPLKIASPSLVVTLLDSSIKRCNFCEAVKRELGLKDINIIHGRAENPLPQKFDVIISRATFSLKNFVESGAIHMAEHGSKIIAYKSLKLEEELEEAKDLILNKGFKVEIKEYQTSNAAPKNKLVIIEPEK